MTLEQIDLFGLPVDATPKDDTHAAAIERDDTPFDVDPRPQPWRCQNCSASNPSWRRDCSSCNTDVKSAAQLVFDGIEPPWVTEWQDMPEFCQHDLQATKLVIVRFATMSDFFDFAERIEKKVTVKTKSLWYPEIESRRYVNKRYRDVES